MSGPTLQSFVRSKSKIKTAERRIIRKSEVGPANDAYSVIKRKWFISRGIFHDVKLWKQN